MNPLLQLFTCKYCHSQEEWGLTPWEYRAFLLANNSYASELMKKIAKQKFVSLNKLLLLAICLSPCLMLLILGLAPGIIFALPLCVGLFFICYLALAYFFNEYLSIEDDTMVYHDSWFNNKKVNRLKVGNLKEILIENESFTSGPGSRKSVYMVDVGGQKTTIVLNKIRALYSVNCSLLRDIAQSYNVPLVEKSFVLEPDLKKRREA